METVIMLDDCAGFRPEAVAKWETLRFGISESYGYNCSEESESLSLSFEETEDPASLAVSCTRLLSLLGEKFHLVSRGGEHFGAFLSTRESASSVRFMEVIGGILFRSPEKVTMLLPVENLDSAITRCFKWFDSQLLPDQKWFTRRFVDAEEVLGSMRRILKLVVIRDILRCFASDGRPLPISVRDLCSSFGIEVHSATVSDDINYTIVSLKPQIENSHKLMEAWEQRVSELYNRTPRSFPRKKAEPTRSSRASKRTRKASKKFGDESDAESMDLGVDNEVQLVVDNWLQCDNCSKWRVVDSSTAQAFEEKFFSCTEVGKTCDDPSDDQI
jgi:hypothetical protein